MDSAVNDAAKGANANKRGSAGRVFEKGEFRPTSLRHFLASSSTRRIAAVAPTAVIELLHWLPARTCLGDEPAERRGCFWLSA